MKDKRDMFPKVCFVCSMPHIQDESVEVTDGVKSWHKCHDSNVVELPKPEEKFMVDGEEVKIPTVDEVVSAGYHPQIAPTFIEQFKEYVRGLGKKTEEEVKEIS